MKTSPAGVALVKRFEGVELTAYRDIAGVWTIGYGHTGPDVRPGMKITQAAAETMLSADLASREDAILRLVTVPLNQNEFDALVSFVYNVGVEAFRKSTARRRLNGGDRAGAAEALTWFDKATMGGVLTVVPGLMRRRAAERALFLTPLETGRFVEAQDDGIVAEPGWSAEATPAPPADYVHEITPPEGRKRGWLERALGRLFGRR